jgi:hypothetical protein
VNRFARAAALFSVGVVDKLLAVLNALRSRTVLVNWHVAAESVWAEESRAASRDGSIYGTASSGLLAALARLFRRVQPKIEKIYRSTDGPT